MLRGWHESKPLSLYSEEAPDDGVDDVILWNEGDCSPPAINPELSEAQIRDMYDIVAEFNDVFSTKPGRTNLAEHRIKTRTPNPVRQAPYLLPHAYREDVKKDLEEMEKDGIIEPSASKWTSPIVLVPKKDGSLRMCVDYCRLNSVSKPPNRKSCRKTWMLFVCFTTTTLTTTSFIPCCRHLEYISKLWPGNQQHRFRSLI